MILQIFKGVINSLAHRPEKALEARKATDKVFLEQPGLIRDRIPQYTANLYNLGCSALLVDQIEEGCIKVPEGGWEEAMRSLPNDVHTARIASARREARKQCARFEEQWRRLIADLVSPGKASHVEGELKAA